MVMVGGVTDEQLAIVRKLADQFGMTESQFGKALPMMGILFHAAQRGDRIAVVPREAPRPWWGGRVYEADYTVDEMTEWEPALFAGCPNTPVNHKIVSAKEMFGPIYVGDRFVRFVLVCLANGADFSQAVGWADQHALRRVCARELFAFAKAEHHLPAKLGTASMYVASSFEHEHDNDWLVCAAWYSGPYRTGKLLPIRTVSGACAWVAFARP